jgi:hypothetical protein
LIKRSALLELAFFTPPYDMELDRLIASLIEIGVHKISHVKRLQELIDKLS